MVTSIINISTYGTYCYVQIVNTYLLLIHILLRIVTRDRPNFIFVSADLPISVLFDYGRNWYWQFRFIFGRNQGSVFGSQKLQDVFIFPPQLLFLSYNIRLFGFNS